MTLISYEVFCLSQTRSARKLQHAMYQVIQAAMLHVLEAFSFIWLSKVRLYYHESPRLTSDCCASNHPVKECDRHCEHVHAITAILRLHAGNISSIVPVNTPGRSQYCGTAAACSSR